jgi:cell division protein FtsQ
MKAKIFKLVQFLFLAAVLVVLGWSSYSAVRYLRTAPRFQVRQLSVSGLRRVRESQIIERANFEIGTNAFEVDLDDMRQRVEELQWVRHALVHRILPNEVVIKVVEREPIGLARIHGEIYEFDADAAVLDPDAASLPSFPILDGLQPGNAEGNKQKVLLYQKVLEDLGSNELSEVHVNDAGEVSVVSTSDGLLVNIGSEDFHARWLKYLQLKAQIQQQYPDAVRVDLRFRNQVIVKMRDEEADKKVIWDAEKKLL